MRNRYSFGGFRALALAAGLGLAVACSPVIRNHGFIPPNEELAQLQIGVDTRETILETLGPTSAGGILDGSGFYYVASQFRHMGALAPEEISREVLAVSFAANGTVSNIERFGLEAGRVVVLSRRVTETGVRDSTFVRQLLGSIGRVNASDLLGDS
jgi:outer membrane protein assembly factor BamE (lipoprotein component of BamABCDE complex)